MNQISHQCVAAFAVLLTFSSGVFAQTPAKPTPEKQAQLISTLAPSLVRVEYTLQFDQGEAPYGSGWATRCPNCGQYHGEDTDGLVPEERPAQLPGFLIAPDQVISTDFMLNPRFIKQINIRAGEQVVSATIQKYFVHQNAVLLKVSQPLTAAKPIAFDSNAAGPYQALSYFNGNADWQIQIQPMEMPLTTLLSGKSFLAADAPSLVLAADGKPVTLAMTEELPADASWKANPSQWQGFDQAEMTKRLDALKQAAGAGLLHVQLSFRSPPASAGERMSGRRYMGPMEDENAPERHSVGVLTSPDTILILTAMKPGLTARLEGIEVTLPDGKTATAKFAGSLNDYGALVAKLDAPLQGAIKLSDKSIFDSRNRLLMLAEVKLKGETRIAYFGHRRIAQFNTGWRQQIYPEFPGETEGMFIFDDAGQLVSLPLSRRDKSTDANQYSRPENQQTASQYVGKVLADLTKNLDSANVPLSEEDEHRMAWLGMELQALDPELARANKVSHLTQNGQHGGLVTYVYPDSPAAKAGIQSGMVVLRAHVEGQPKPIEVEVDQYAFAEQPFPWDRFNELPEQYFEQIPRPWPPVESPLTRALTDLGFGKTFELEYAVDGVSKRQKFEVVQSPAHFDTAPRAVNAALGLTVRGMTYEVRRYFQRTSDDPGVIVSKIEAGSKASLAGLKPYEFITHVNDQPVASPADFERLIKAGGTLQLNVRRMTRGRVVQVKLDAPAAN